MAALKAYFDDSSTGTDKSERWFALGGLVVEANVWQQMEKRWNSVLDAFGIRYFHMKEYTGSSRGTPFEKLKHKESLRKDLLAALVGIIVDTSTGRVPVFTLVNAGDLDQFNKEKGLNVHPYSLGTAVCKAQMSSRWGTVECVVDNFNRCSSLAEKGNELLRLCKDERLQRAADRVVTIPSPCPAVCIPGLQMADWAVWEARRYWGTHATADFDSGCFNPRKPFDRLVLEGGPALSCRIDLDEIRSLYSRADPAELHSQFGVE